MKNSVSGNRNPADLDDLSKTARSRSSFQPRCRCASFISLAEVKTYPAAPTYGIRCAA